MTLECLHDFAAEEIERRITPREREIRSALPLASQAETPLLRFELDRIEARKPPMPACVAAYLADFVERGR